MGKIFGYMALCRSGILSQPLTRIEDITMMISSLIKVSTQKSYLIEASYSLILDIVVVYLKDSPLRNISAQIILDQMLTDKNITYQELWIIIILQQQFNHLSWDDILTGWKCPSQVLGTVNKPNLKVILKVFIIIVRSLHLQQRECTMFGLQLLIAFL